jgi:hypothetical protein
LPTESTRPMRIVGFFLDVPYWYTWKLLDGCHIYS